MEGSLGADQDSVRLLAVEGCAALGKLLEPADCVANVLPVIVSFSQVRCCRPPSGRSSYLNFAGAWHLTFRTL